MSQSPASASPLAPVKRPLNLRETVLEQLRTAIVTGELAEGELVSAPTLGQALGVSATPVREAMMDLVREGLVDVDANDLAVHIVQCYFRHVCFLLTLLCSSR